MKKTNNIKNSSENKAAAALKHNFSGWILLIPAIICLILVQWHPTIKGFYNSFFETRGYEITEFVGLQNYKDVLSDTMFLTTVKNTVMYVFWSLLIGFVPPLLLAVLLNEIVHCNRLFRTITYLPYLSPGVVTAIVWGFLFMPGANGALNSILGWFGIEPIGWLNDSGLAIPSIVLSMTWQGIPGSTVIYLAALQGVSQDQYEAAIIDGAGIWKRFKSVTMPAIGGTTLLLAARQIIGVFQVMQEPLIMTNGGPDNATLSLGLATYRYAFTYMKVSKALALGVVSFLMLLVITVIYFKLEKKIKE